MMAYMWKLLIITAWLVHSGASQGQIKETDSQFNFLLHQMKLLKNEVSALKQANHRIIDDLKAKDKDLKAKQKEINQLKVKCGKVDENSPASFNISEIGEPGKSLYQQNFVAFSAYPTANRDIGGGGKIQFDAVITNVGEHYNTAESTFVCPVSAYYIFSVTGRSTGGILQATIQLDSSPLVTAFSDRDNDFDQATNTVVILCDVNQEVAVFNTGGGVGMYGGRDSAFTGALLSLA